MDDFRKRKPSLNDLIVFYEYELKYVSPESDVFINFIRKRINRSDFFPGFPVSKSDSDKIFLAYAIVDDYH
jgi:hypothetical protein